MAKKENIMYLTQDGYDKLVEELNYLKETRRIEIADKLKEAIAFGDLSENAEYEEARSEQAQLEIRISEIEEQLKTVQVAEDDSESDTGKITIGSIVKLETHEDDEIETGTYKIVGKTEANILVELPRISNESPVGKAIFGKKKGDKVKVKALSGNYEAVVLEVE